MILASQVTTTDPGASYAVQSKTEQTLDTHGNAVQIRQYEYGNLSTPARTYNLTYLAGSNYTSRYIFNRRTGVSMTAGGQTTVRETVAYDGLEVFWVNGGYNEWKGRLYDLGALPLYGVERATAVDNSVLRFAAWSFDFVRALGLFVGLQILVFGFSGEILLETVIIWFLIPAGMHRRVSGG